MNMELEQLIVEIERKDQRFRVAQAIFMVAVGIGLLFVGALAVDTLANLNKQPEERKQGIIAIENTINAKVDCLEKFDKQPNRADLKLVDPKTCEIKASGASVPSVSSNTIKQPTQAASEQPLTVSHPSTPSMTTPTAPASNPTPAASQPPSTPTPKSGLIQSIVNTVKGIL